MPQCTADFETGVNGNNIGTGDAGSSTAWNSTTQNGTTTAKYDNTHVAQGTLAAQLFSGDNTGHLEWDTAFGTQTDHYGRMYLYLTANPSDNLPIVYVTQSFVRAARVDINLNGKLFLLDNPVNTTTGSVSVSLNQWVRIEWHVVHSTTAGVIEAKLFNTASSSTPDETVTSPSNWNTLSNGTEIDFGCAPFIVSNYTYWKDAIVAAATSYPGPVAVTQSVGILDVPLRKFGPF